MSDVSWTTAQRAVTCRVCEWSGDGADIATIEIPSGDPIHAVKCLHCGSLDLLNDPHPSSPTDIVVDEYVEVGGGVGTIAELLSLVDHRRVSRFLDVGCGYGFSLDLGRALFGWDVVGVEPSLAGTRGATELDVDIRNEYLTESSDVGHDFDLVFSSEVLEHVTDPVGFLEEIRKRLSPSGQVILTTPAAEIVSPDEPIAEVVAAISGGYHVFLASEEGLGIVLARAGFPFSRITRSRGSLRAVASLQELDIATPPPVTAGRLQEYFASRAKRADPATPLGLGMATRLLRLAVARGDFPASEEAAPLVIAAFAARYGIRLDRRAELESSLSTASAIWSLPGAAFAMGMVELLHRNNPQAAARYFSIARQTAGVWRDTVGVPDLDIVDLIYQAEYHRLIAQARFDGVEASAGALTLRESLDASARGVSDIVRVAQVRIFVEMVASGTEAGSGALASIVAAGVGLLVSSPDSATRAAGLDGMYSLGLAAQRSDDLETAHRWLERCISECVALAPPDAHAVELIRLCQAVLPPRANVSLPPLHQMIDLYWADASGTFLQGWAHAEWLPVEAITIGNGRSSVTAERHDREDLLGFWPGEPEVVRGGFRAYLPGPPHSSVTITAHTRLGPIALSAELPDHPLPSAPEGASLLSIRERIAAIVEAAPSGPVLAIGVRAKTQESLEAQLSHFVGREVIGLDIHSGIGVDRVGDAHALDEMFSKDQFAIVYSASLLEHVAAPWLVAAQCASVTAPGGVNIHQAPWVWPTHSAPNDFWRFSPEGLEQLFSPAIGFRVLFSAGYGEATVTPHGEWREQSLAMPTLYSGASSWIAAEKVANPSAAVSWPSSTETNIETARRYPIDGIADLGGTT